MRKNNDMHNIDRSFDNKQFFASCPAGLEEVLLQELQEITTMENPIIQRGGVDFYSKPLDAIKALTESRIASRLFRYQESFIASNEKDIYHYATNISWNKILTLNQTFKINTLLDQTAQDQFNNSHHLSLVLKDGIVDNFRRTLGKRPNIDLKYPDISFLLRITKTKEKGRFQANLLIDLCGAPLSNRGYRIKKHIAPLRENLAAGLVLFSKWDSKNYLLHDPMCGSGTILIEAAMIAKGLPGSFIKIINYKEKNYQPFAFLKHNWFLEDKDLQRKTFSYLDQLYSKITETLSEKNTPVNIFGTELSQESIKMCRSNLSAAGLSHFVKIKTADCTQITPFLDGQGVIISNPPYGERLESDNFEKLQELYYNFGENLKKNFKGYTAYIITSEPSLRKKISLQTSERIQIYNGKLECRLLKYKIF